MKDRLEMTLADVLTERGRTLDEAAAVADALGLRSVESLTTERLGSISAGRLRTLATTLECSADELLGLTQTDTKDAGRNRVFLDALDRATDANDVLLTTMTLIADSANGIDKSATPGLFSILLNVHKANEALFTLLTRDESDRA